MKASAGAHAVARESPNPVSALLWFEKD